MSVKIESTLFHADRCGHCKHFLPEWKKLEDKIKGIGGKVGNVTINVQEFEESKIDKSKVKINGKDIRGYPTVKIAVEKNGKKVENEYDGKRSADELYFHLTEQASKNIK